MMCWMFRPTSQSIDWFRLLFAIVTVQLPVCFFRLRFRYDFPRGRKVIYKSSANERLGTVYKQSMKRCRMNFLQLLHHILRYKRWLIGFVFIILIRQQLQYLLSVYNNISMHEDFNLEYFDDDPNGTESSTLIIMSDMPKTKRKSPLEYKPDLPTCPDFPAHLVGKVTSHTSTNLSQALPWSDIISANSKIFEGRFSPKTCKSRHRVAIIIPLRNRESQLRVLLSHMHPIWQRQEIDYTVYTITQAGEGLFNRAKLINVGVAEAKKDREYDCFVFHDVDLLVEDDRCLYWCHHPNPRHVAMHMDKFDYEPLIYMSACRPLSFFYNEIKYFGGVSMMTAKQFEYVNGFSNLYWGWGGEDDDMYFRLRSRGYSIANPYGRQCSFRMIAHDHESSNAENEARYPLLYHSTSRMEKDGFNSLRYKWLSTERLPMYVNITVDVGKPVEKMLQIMSRKLSWWGKCIVRMPWR